MSQTNLTYALAQINVTVGDIHGNCQKILDYYAQAKAQGADMVITPESSITGYSPEDLVLLDPFLEAAMQAVHTLAKETKDGPALVVGSPWAEKGRTYNAALLLDDGEVVHVQQKTVLPNHGVFDERRIYEPGRGTVVGWRGVKLGILVCEDTWSDIAPDYLAAQGAELFISINASPFHAGKRETRRDVVRHVATKHSLPIMYLALIGAQDDIVFDGGSFVLSRDGKELHTLPEFEEHLCFVSHQNLQEATQPNDSLDVLKSEEQTIWEAMKLGVRDYTHKNGFSKVLLGLSGGIDSAFTAAVAVDALGAENVTGVLMPSPYSSDHSMRDAQESAQLLGINTLTIPIKPGMQAFEAMLTPTFEEENWMQQVLVGGNLQSRLRGVTLMALSNKYGWMLLSTGNKSEIAVGYSTLYGDACGSYNPIKDLYKTQVYSLARWRNEQGAAIPEASIIKAPSAELSPGQLDSDQLPPYDLLDEILYHHIEDRMASTQIIALGFDEPTVRKVVKLVLASEYKRRQSCPGPKLSTMMFGKDRRFPLTNKF